MSSPDRSVPGRIRRLFGRKRPLRLVFFSKTSLLRHFDTVLMDIARQGHELVLVTSNKNPLAKVPGKLHKFENVTCHSYKLRREDDLQGFVAISRSARDYLRYLSPELRVAWANRDRAWDVLTAVASGSTRSGDSRSGPWAELNLTELTTLNNAFAKLEELVPTDPGVERYISSLVPDAVLVTPLITFGSRQTEIVKACRSLGIPCGLPVFSWDNLSNKGTIHACPDRVFVWNDVQADEAVELQGVPRERVVVTGAARFDECFEFEPTEERAGLRARLGLDPDGPVVLYLGSSPFVAGDEPPIVDRWIEAIRSCPDPTVRRAGIIVRPHPRSRETWGDWSPDRWPGVVLDERASIYGLARLYERIYASDAVVALNTSGQIEAAILGKPVYTIDMGSDAPGQTGSSHYYYLLRENGGFVEHASTLETHLAQLGRGLGGDVDAAAIRRFAESFVRPRGLDRPSTPITARAFIELAEEGRASRERRLPGEEQPVAARPIVAAPEPCDDEDGDDDSTVRVDFPDQELRIHATSEAERRWRARACHKEPWTVAWLRENLRAGDVLYDIGANVGAFSLIATALVAGQGTVVSFEPGFASYARLCENIALNGYGGAIVPVPLALSRESSVQAFTYRTLEPGQSRHRHDGSRWQAGEQRKGNGKRYTQPILGIRVDDAIELFGLPRPTLIKIDVDGGELDVLAGAGVCLADPGLRSVLIEVDRSGWDSAIDELSAAGFRLRERHGEDDARVWYAELVR